MVEKTPRIALDLNIIAEILPTEHFVGHFKSALGLFLLAIFSFLYVLIFDHSRFWIVGKLIEHLAVDSSALENHDTAH